MSGYLTLAAIFGYLIFNSMTGSTKPTRVLYLVKRAETAARAGLEACLSDLQVTPAHYTIMALLASQRDQSSADLARKAGVTPQTMSEAITALERRRLIARVENPAHRRILKISLTSEGRALLKRCDVLVDAMEQRLLRGLSAQQIQALREALGRIAFGSSAN
jgi:DNA-binding MarR family transcriptional regulator